MMVVIRKLKLVIRNILEFKQIKKNLVDFFGMGTRRIKGLKITPVNIDKAIAEAVTDNNLPTTP